MSWSDAFGQALSTWGQVKTAEAEADSRSADEWKALAERTVEQSSSYQESGRQLQQNTVKVMAIAGVVMVGAVVAYRAFG